MSSKEYFKEYYKNNKHKYKYDPLAKRNPTTVMLVSARQRCKVSGLECTITAEDISFPEVCPYLGIPLLTNKGGLKDNSYSLDRIDNSKGYIPGNVRVISNKANKMKSNATHEELITFAKRILELHEC